MSNEYNIRLDHVSLKNSAVVNNGSVHNTINNTALDATLLQDLSDAQNRLADSESLIADAIGELREALMKKDEKTVAQKVKALSGGTAAEVLKGVASAVVLRFLKLA